MSKFQFSDAALSLIGEVAAFVVVVAIVVVLAMLRVRPKRPDAHVVVEVSQSDDEVDKSFDVNQFVRAQVLQMLVDERKATQDGEEPKLLARTFPPAGYYHKFGYSLQHVSISKMESSGENYQLVSYFIDRNMESPRTYYSVLYRRR